MQALPSVDCASSPPDAIDFGSDLGMTPVSDLSLWRDDKWRFINPVPGQKRSASVISWKKIYEYDFKDDYHFTVNSWLKIAAYVHIAGLSGFSRPSPGGFCKLSAGISGFRRWLAVRGLRQPSDIDGHVLRSLPLDIPILYDQELGDTDENVATISHNFAVSVLHIPIIIWRAADFLAEAGFDPMPDLPFEGRPIRNIVKGIVDGGRTARLCIPDEVAVRLLNKASWMLGAPAQDALRLLELVHEVHVRSKSSSKFPAGEPCADAYQRRLRRKKSKYFALSVPPGEEQSWQLPSSYSPDLDTVQHALRLVKAVQSAAVIVLQSTTGMRIGEICGLESGIDQESGLPRCVKVEVSPSGLYKIFSVTSVATKGANSLECCEWIVGIQPRGTEGLPLFVKSILVLERLLARYRALSGTSKLLVNISSPRGLPVNEIGTAPATGSYLLKGVRSFISDWVDLQDLPDESAHGIGERDLQIWKTSKGRVLQTRMLRRMWATFAYSVDPGLLPAIQQQFHHVNQAVTERSYIGRPGVRLTPLSSVREQQTQLALFDLVMGRDVAGGRMGERLQISSKNLKAACSGLLRSEMWAAVARFVDDNRIRIWFSSYGDCFALDLSEMRCHALAGTKSL